MSPTDVPESHCSMSMTGTRVVVIGFVSLSFHLIFPLSKKNLVDKFGPFHTYPLRYWNLG